MRQKKNSILASRHQRYISNSAPEKAYSKQYYELNKTRKNAASQEYYNLTKDERNACSSDYYNAHKQERKAYFSKYYETHKAERIASEMKAAFGEYYDTHKDEMKAMFSDYYKNHKQERKASFKKYYEIHKENIKAARSLYYASHRSQELAAARARRVSKAKAVVRRARKYYAKNRDRICADMRRRYELAEPKPKVRQHYVNKLTEMFLTTAKTSQALVEAFTNQHRDVAAKMSRSTLKRAASSIAAKRIINRVLQERKKYAGSLLKALRSISKIIVTDKSDFGESLHSVHSEPYFYEAAYAFINRPGIMCVDEQGIYRPADVTSEESIESVPRTWKCSDKCKPLLDSEINSILHFKLGFEEPLSKVRKLLDECDACPNNRYAKVVLASPKQQEEKDVPLCGHSCLCYTGNDCQSQLRILRVASTHHPVLRSLLRAVYAALRSHKTTAELDAALSAGDCDHLMKVGEFKSYEDVFSNAIQSTHKLSDSVTAESVLRKPGLENQLEIAHAKLIALYEKQVRDYAQHPCCSCRILFKRQYVTRVHLSDNLGRVWSELKDFILNEDENAADQTLFMCNYCNPIVRRGQMPPRCVLNGLYTIPIPEELAKLDCLSRQFVQRVKAYQTVVRLGTYTHKVPIYNSLKACKGNMFFLPLPMANTMDTLEEVQKSHVTLPDPNLYIIVNGKPTKTGVVWRSLVQAKRTEMTAKIIFQIKKVM